MAYRALFTDSALKQLGRRDRLVCDIQDSVLIIEVLKIGNRKEVYR